MSDTFDRLAAYLRGEPIVKITVSCPFHKGGVTKIVCVPVANARFPYQLSFFTKTQVTHENPAGLEHLIESLFKVFQTGFRQWDIQLSSKYVKLLTNPKGTATFAEAPCEDAAPAAASGHNREKKRLFPVGEPRPWLVELGVMTPEGAVRADMQKKFKQLNRYAELVADVAHLLPPAPTIVDFGCGKSYLTFALYDYLTTIGKAPRVIGLDLKADVIAHCEALAGKLHFDGLHFSVGDIARFKPEPGTTVDMVVSLHACDTATDYALYNAVKWRAGIIFCVPCCQHELNAQIRNESFNPLLRHGILKERLSALLTDALRAEVLEAQGYVCQVMEFIDMAHTPKNILIRAMKRSRPQNQPDGKADTTLADIFHLNPTIHNLFER